MPRITEMFPRLCMHHTDFAFGEVQYGTIKAVEMFSARASFQRPQSGQRQQAQAQMDWMLFFHEYPKPMRLKPQRAKAIELLLRSDNTDDWIGRRIGFMRGAVPIGNEMVECLIIDMRLPPAETRTMLGAAGASKFLVEGQKGKLLPQAAVDRFVKAVKSKGRTWEDYLEWAKRHEPRVHELVSGCALDAIDAATTPAMKTYLDELHGASSAEPAPQRPVNAATGVPIEPEFIPEEEIPF